MQDDSAGYLPQNAYKCHFPKTTNNNQGEHHCFSRGGAFPDLLLLRPLLLLLLLLPPLPRPREFSLCATCADACRKPVELSDKIAPECLFHSIVTKHLVFVCVIFV